MCAAAPYRAPELVETVTVTLRRAAAAIALVLSPALVSCGFDQPTNAVYTPGEGVNARSGQVDVLHALVVSGADGSGTVVASLVNNDREDADTLTQVTGAAEGAALQVSLDAPVEIPAGGAVQLLEEEVPVEGEAIVPGRFVELTFTFERAETATVEVPVVTRSGDYADIPVPSIAPATPTPEHDTGGH
jgi:hypothetical protein